MISEDGWFDWMIRDPGPIEKTNTGVNTLKLVVPHSAEGYWPYLGTLLHSLERRASWFASNLKDGRCFQHYSVYQRTWTSGAGYPNNNGLAWENEGVAGQPLTPEQVDNCVTIISDIAALKGWQPVRPLSDFDVQATCYEHNECQRWGAEFTSCPSGRIPWDIIIPRVEENLPMTPEERARLEALEEENKTRKGEIQQMFGTIFGNPFGDTKGVIPRVEKLEAKP